MEKDDEFMRIGTAIRERNPCNIAEFLSNIQILTKNSASESMVVRGKISLPGRIPESVIIKFTPHSRNNNSAIVERQIYSHVTNKLLLDRNTPCLTKYLGHYTCTKDEISPSFTGTNALKYKKFITEAKRKECDIEHIHVIVSEDAGGTFLSDIGIADLPEVDQVRILFMIGYTLLNFGHIGLRHNDLHTGNTIIHDTGVDNKLSFMIPDGKVVQFRSRVIPKIYDFDRSAIYYPNVQRNEFLDSEACPLYNSCNDEFPSFDLYTLIATLMYDYHYKMRSTVAVFLEQTTGYRRVYEENKKVTSDRTAHLLNKEVFDFAKRNMMSVETFVNSLVSTFSRHFNLVSQDGGTFVYAEARPIPNLIHPSYDGQSERFFKFGNGDMDVTDDNTVSMIENMFRRMIDGEPDRVDASGEKDVYDPINYPKQWIKECIDIEYTDGKTLQKGLDIQDLATELAKATLKKKRFPQSRIKTVLYEAYAFICIAMSLPIFPQISTGELSSVYRSYITRPPIGVKELVSDIWATHRNILPIEYPDLFRINTIKIENEIEMAENIVSTPGTDIKMLDRTLNDLKKANYSCIGNVLGLFGSSITDSEIKAERSFIDAVKHIRVQNAIINDIISHSNSERKKNVVWAGSHYVTTNNNDIPVITRKTNAEIRTMYQMSSFFSNLPQGRDYVFICSGIDNSLNLGPVVCYWNNQRSVNKVTTFNPGCKHLDLAAIALVCIQNGTKNFSPNKQNVSGLESSLSQTWVIYWIANFLAGGAGTDSWSSKPKIMAICIRRFILWLLTAFPMLRQMVEKNYGGDAVTILYNGYKKVGINMPKKGEESLCIG